jgi:hypothetical protein
MTNTINWMILFLKVSMKNGRFELVIPFLTVTNNTSCSFSLTSFKRHYVIVPNVTIPNVTIPKVVKIPNINRNPEPT